MSSEAIMWCRAQPPLHRKYMELFHLLPACCHAFINLRRSGYLDRDFAGSVCGTLISDRREHNPAHLHLTASHLAYIHARLVQSWRAIRPITRTANECRIGCAPNSTTAAHDAWDGKNTPRILFGELRQWLALRAMQCSCNVRAQRHAHRYRYTKTPTK